MGLDSVQFLGSVGRPAVGLDEWAVWMAEWIQVRAGNGVLYDGEDGVIGSGS